MEETFLSIIIACQVLTSPPGNRPAVCGSRPLTGNLSVCRLVRKPWPQAPPWRRWYREGPGDALNMCTHGALRSWRHFPHGTVSSPSTCRSSVQQAWGGAPADQACGMPGAAELGQPGPARPAGSQTLESAPSLLGVVGSQTLGDRVK